MELSLGLNCLGGSNLWRRQTTLLDRVVMAELDRGGWHCSDLGLGPMRIVRNVSARPRRLARCVGTITGISIVLDWFLSIDLGDPC